MSDIRCNNHRIKTKKEIVKEIEAIIERIKAGEGNEAKKSVKSHNAYIEFAERFLKKVKRTRIPEIHEEGWGFFVEITENAAAVHLNYTEYDEDIAKSETGYVYSIFESFDLIRLKPRMLTVEDYAQLHEVNVGTVRQWIRRGKIRKAQKIGKEWRIPEFVEPATGKYPDGIFYWNDEKLPDLPPEYSCLNDYDELGITQMDADTYKVGLLSWRGKYPKRKLLLLNAKEREKLELFLISNPFVICDDGCMNFDLFENSEENINVNENGR